MSIFSEFREFIARGNVIDLAVGVIIGGAFGKIVTSLVEGVIMPPIGLLTSGVDFSRLSWVLKADDPATTASELVAIQYGAFLNTLIQTGTPAYFCVRPWRDPGIDRIGTLGTAGMYTRYELVFFPRPDRTLRLSFRYLFVFPGVADWIATGNATTDIHPPGMAYHHETMLASCLAVAEQYADSPNGEHREYFAKRIAASVALDRKTAGSAYFGRNLDRSDTLYSQGRSPLSTDITYNNTLY